MSPLPNTQVIGPGWSAHHRGTANGAQTSQCSIRRPGGAPGAFDPDAGSRTYTAPDPYWSGSCRVQELNASGIEPGSALDIAGDRITQTRYLVAIDHAASDQAIHVGDVVTITSTDDNADLSLSGRTLIVAAIERGSLNWETDLVCDDTLD